MFLPRLSGARGGHSRMIFVWCSPAPLRPPRQQTFSLRIRLGWARRWLAIASFFRLWPARSASSPDHFSRALSLRKAMGRWAQARKRGTDRGAGPAFAYAPPAAGDWTLTLAFITATIHIVSSPVGPTNYLVAESFDSGGPY